MLERPTRTKKNVTYSSSVDLERGKTSLPGHVSRIRRQYFIEKTPDFAAWVSGFWGLRYVQGFGLTLTDSTKTQ